MASWQEYLAQNRERFIEELLEFLRIPSISSLPEHADDVQEAAEWVAERMLQAGIEGVRILPTEGHPVVYGDWLHAPGKPTILIYGHFDTQPVDPLELWTHPPFEPVIQNGRVYARGASDDKGNMLIPILAVEALLQTEGKLPVNVKFFFEGQEEIGSPHLPPFVAANRELLACDMVVSSDGGQWSEDQPALSVAFRGLCALQIDVVGARRDLHSGSYGGAVQNPIHALVRILDSMRSPDGKILVDGFYDDVVFTEEDRRLIAQVPFDEAEFKAELGVTELFGEPGYSTLERIWARPTLEVNGIWGGFQGEGVKTVLPNQAHAKITCRLVANQQPARIRELIAAHIKQHTPPGVKVNVHPFASAADPYRMPVDHPGNQAARAVHLQLYGKEPYYVRSGGTIPVCSLFLQHLGAYTVNFAFGLKDEQAHAPNEFFRLSSFDRGQQAYCLLLHQLATVDSAD
ncbi:dipeptidase [Litorilinea aerophila]|uniref:Dipeptidase n=1 Tax=Litorilinea aerophila TaxID=1204385 RepID=A0A540VEW3_9CHLR|nr:dipeptidase [Litorilinea aerophila]MCC9077048.1 dipeptidase [Litorilinea aerophila]GIV76744.1 MAG: peptidase M20 [Litorilinea sp.]